MPPIPSMTRSNVLKVRERDLLLLESGISRSICFFLNMAWSRNVLLFMYRPVCTKLSQLHQQRTPGCCHFSFPFRLFIKKLISEKIISFIIARILKTSKIQGIIVRPYQKYEMSRREMRMRTGRWPAPGGLAFSYFHVCGSPAWQIRPLNRSEFFTQRRVYAVLLRKRST